ncbi:MAG: VOC family protein [Chloroflexi bacterium]|nr:VOC family protein [Chloroflexota bacterium]
MLVNHVGIVVRDMEKSIAFYRDGLGLTVFVDEMVSGPDVDEQCDVKNGKFRLVLLIDTAANAVELWEWKNPLPEPTPAEPNRFNSAGFFEIGLLVDDLDEAEKRLIEKGYSFTSPVWDFCKGRGLFGGAYGKVRYLLDPDGVRVELVQLILEDEPGL